MQKLVQEKLKQTDISFSEKLSALKTSMDAIVKEVSVNSELYLNTFSIQADNWETESVKPVVWSTLTTNFSVRAPWFQRKSVCSNSDCLMPGLVTSYRI